MRIDTEISIDPAFFEDRESWKKILAKKLKLSPTRIQKVVLKKRSIDARGKPVYRLQCAVYVDEKPIDEPVFLCPSPKVLNKEAPSVLICGCGPAGLFAALQLIEAGLRPVLLERGKTLRERKIDIAKFQRTGKLNTDSNYCFGEGGAGSFSDGKLYTRSNKRGDIHKVLQYFVAFGADESILWDAHPHIGSDKLPRIVERMRNYILSCGGEILFETKVVDILVDKGRFQGVMDQNGKSYEASDFILASGHSASDIYFWFDKNKYRLEAKAFALGVRLEHPQALIDRLQYRLPSRPAYLPAAEYSMQTQVEGRGVFSFCMCPGGVLIPSATEEDGVLVNGMSDSGRSSRFANAGMVLSINSDDYQEFENFGPLKGLYFRRDLEKKMYHYAGSTHKVPAQRMTDFVQGRLSSDLPETSYHLGVINAPLHALLPSFISRCLQKAFQEFDKKKKGFLSSEALVLGLESRTSSPVRILRDPSSLEHPDIKGLYPCGEGAGYAGGITSSAIDGINCANKIIEKHGRN